MRTTLAFILFFFANRICEAQTPFAPSKEQIRQWISDLDHSSFKLREAAHRELSRFAEFAGDELGEAADSDDVERARRAKQILGWSTAAPHTHRAVDALGRPIKFARISITQNGATSSVVADREGRFGVPIVEKKIDRDIVVEVRHSGYGAARWIPNARHLGTSELIECKLPLVSSQSEARKRAVHGKVVDSSGKPIHGATIRCSNVRTQGEGLIMVDAESAEVITESDGAFTLYPAVVKPARNEKNHGELVPPSSRFNLLVRTPERDDCFPRDDMFANGDPIEIRMPRASLFRRFRFPLAGGGEINDPKEFRNVVVEVFPNGDDPARVRLTPAEVAMGRKLIPGKYVATHYQNGKVTHYEPIRVDERSPELLTFELPNNAAPTVFRGRAIDGITGQAMPGVWAAAIQSTSRANLAELTADDWRQLRGLKGNADANDPAWRIVSKHFGIGALVRGGDDGFFEIAEPVDRRFYSIIVFAENALPISERVGDVKRTGKVLLADVPLFPAARIDVTIAAKSDKTVPVMPDWDYEPGEQPEWFANFRKAADGNRREFSYVHWLPLNQPHLVFVPADVRLKARFHSPYDDRWGSAATGIVRVPNGETTTVGEVLLPTSLPVHVRVVDSDGKPLEGYAVRALRANTKTWTVAHTTDAKGAAQFFVPPNSSGKFRIEIGNAKPGARPESVEATYRVGESPPDSAVEVRLTAAQARIAPGSNRK